MTPMQELAMYCGVNIFILDWQNIVKFLVNNSNKSLYT